ncbi:hypothetical protein FI667_g4690, partial [Globisporangium splendens]
MVENLHRTPPGFGLDAAWLFWVEAEVEVQVGRANDGLEICSGMEPKKNPKKKSDAPVDRDVLIATNEYLFIPFFYLCLCNTTTRLREEAKIIERMTCDNKSKQEQINSMEAMLQREIEKHQATLRMLEDEHLTQKMHAEHEIEVLNCKVSELELHVEAYDVVESANVTLRDRVDKLMLQLEHESKSHAEEIHKVRLDMFNHKMALEKKVENEILEQESHLRLQEVSSMKKAQLVASRTTEKLKDEVIKEEQEWKEQTSKVVEELRQENMHLQKLYEASQHLFVGIGDATNAATNGKRGAWSSQNEKLNEAPTSVTSWYPISRTQSQPSLSQDSPASARADVPINYDEMWSASLKNSNERQHKVDLLKSRKAADSIVPSGFLQPVSIDLERIATSNLEIRS